MTEPCCSKPKARIIKVGTFEAGIVGLEEILRTVSTSGITTEKDLGATLLRLARQYGNYIAPGVEELYKEALLGEFKLFRKGGKESAP